MLNLNINIQGIASERVSVPVPDPEIIGSIFSESTWANLNDFTVLGSGVTLGAGYVNMTGGLATFNDKLYFSKSTSPHKITCLEQWNIRVKCKTPATLNTTSYGIGLGVDSTAAEEYSTSVRWAWSIGAGENGSVRMYTHRTTTNQITHTSVLTPTADTVYVLEFIRDYNTLTFNIYASDGTTLLATRSSALSLSTGATVQPHNTGSFCIQNYGGTNIQIQSWSVTTPAMKNLDYVCVGDSNMYGLFATAKESRYVTQALASQDKSFEVLAGIADRTGDIVTRLPEIIALNPRNVYVNLGSNDVANGVATGTWQSNLDTIISTLETAGITVKLGSPVARSTNLTAVQTYINGKSNQKVDLFAVTKSAGTTLNATYNSGDNIHINLAGHNACAPAFESII